MITAKKPTVTGVLQNYSTPAVINNLDNVAIHYLATAHMLLDGQLTGLLEASHHVGFLTFRRITFEYRELVEHNAVIE
jgi:hypothetical protein